MNFRKIVNTGLLALSLAGLTSCNQSQIKPEAESKSPIYQISEFEIDQVFRDHSGIKVIYTDASNRVLEFKVIEYLDWNHNCDKVHIGNCHYPNISDTNLNARVKSFDPKKDIAYGMVRDLPSGSKPLDRVIIFNYRGHRPKYHEIHLAKDGKLNAGTDSWRSGKTTQYGNMGEIK